MSHKLIIFLIGLFLITATFGPRLVLAENMPVRPSCHETSAEMPTACAIHCFFKAVSETKVEIVPTLSVDFIFPGANSLFSAVPISRAVFCSFFEDAVFRDRSVILTIIKRE